MDWTAQSAFGNFRAVQHTRELERVLRIPRRIWDDAEARAFAEQLTQALKKPQGGMSLRPIQALALYEAGTVGGLFGPIGVGQGKTLISLLAPFVLFSRRPLLLTRANLIEKTKRDWRALAPHWPIPNFIRIESYEKLGRAGHSQLLDQYAPDLIISDECHRLKNRKAAVTRRVSRYMDHNPQTRFIAISGTITRKSLLEWAHLIRWALKVNAPIPGADHYRETEEWAEALDEKPTGDNLVKPGALAFFCNAQERQDPDPLTAVRKAYRRRLVETPGVVATTDNLLGCSLTIQVAETDLGPAVSDAFRVLRSQWETPDGWPISDPMTLNRHARELALGFYYVWDPRPPVEWLEPRREWSKVCREILANNKRHLDSELQVIQAVDAGHYPQAVEALERWREVKPSFIPNTVPVWLDDSVIQFCARWMAQGPGLVWCEHRAFAIELARQTGIAYYAERGLDGGGRYVEDHPAGEPAILSVASNLEGRNLQTKWSRNLIVSPPANAQVLEQLLGRTHRSGQEADEVTADVICTVIEHAEAFDRAKRQAAYIEATTGQSQKLLYADVTFPSVEDILLTKSGPRWQK